MRLGITHGIQELSFAKRITLFQAVFVCLITCSELEAVLLVEKRPFSGGKTAFCLL